MSFSSASSIEWIILDAVGTLIQPVQKVSTTYACIAKQFGIDVSEQAISQRFRHIFQSEEARTEQTGGIVSEKTELQRWQTIVAECLQHSPRWIEAFSSLWTFFSTANAWQLTSGVQSALKNIHQRGIRLAIGSNFDSRLRNVLAGHGVLPLLQHVFISSEVGLHKPASRFYHHVLATIGSAAEKVVWIGDHPIHDYEAPQKFGMQAYLYDPEQRHSCKCKIADWRELNHLQL